MTRVSRDQFEVLNDTQVRHTPTGATVSTYRYDEPTPENIAGGGPKVNWGNAGNVLPNGDDYERDDILRAAVELLAELGHTREAEKKKKT